MKIKHIVLGLSLMTGLAFAQSGQTSTGTQDQNSTPMGKHHRGGDRHEDMQEHMDKVATELNLTADQKTQVQGIMKDTGDQMRAIRQDTSLTKEQKEAKVKELHESTHSKINAVLTPDQQKKFAEIRKDNREREGKHWDKDGKKHDKDDKDKQ